MLACIALVFKVFRKLYIKLLTSKSSISLTGSDRLEYLCETLHTCSSCSWLLVRVCVHACVRACVCLCLCVCVQVCARAWSKIEKLTDQHHCYKFDVFSCAMLWHSYGTFFRVRVSTWPATKESPRWPRTKPPHSHTSWYPLSFSTSRQLRNHETWKMPSGE